MKQNTGNLGNDLTSRPLAVAGLTSYRCQGCYGWIMIGAKDHDDAMSEARRSSVSVKKEDLQVWNGGEYVPVVWPDETSMPLPRHALIILAVQHCNMAPKMEQPSHWWYSDKDKGWDYLTKEGYQEYQRLEQEFPDVVKAHREQTKSALRACFDRQAGPVLAFASGT